MLSYPFIDPFLVKTFDISDDPKIITKLTAAEGYKSVIEKIYIKNTTESKIVANLIIAIQSDKKTTLTGLPDYLRGKEEEYIETVIDYYPLQESMLIEKKDTKQVNLLEDFILEPNEFLMLNTNDDAQIVDCFVSQVILKSS